MSRSSGVACRMLAAQASTLARSALPACQAASPPMPAAPRGPGAAAIGVLSVSPVMTRTCSIGTPKAEAATCAITRLGRPGPAPVTRSGQMDRALRVELHGDAVPVPEDLRTP